MSSEKLDLARTAYEKQDYKAALTFSTDAIKENHNFYEAWVVRGASLMWLGNFYSSILNFDRAIKIRSDIYDAWNNRGTAYFRLAMFKEAIADFEKAIELEPTQHMSPCQLGILYGTTNRPIESEFYLRRALHLCPEDSNSFTIINIFLATLLQGLGRWQEGFQKDQHRFKISKQKFTAPQWTGEDLSGKHLLLFTEGGWGDKILSLRYVNLLRERYPDTELTIATQKDLVSLASRSYPGLNIVPSTVPSDYMSSLLDVPMALKLTWDTVPRPQKYLTIAQDRVEKWGQKLKGLPPGMKVGLCWASFNGVSKTILPHEMEEFGGIPNVSYISLQKPRIGISSKVKLIDYTDEINDWADTGAIIENLDLVVTVDTGVAHLAGALGKPVWNIVRFSTFWPWMAPNIPRSPDYSIWYPSMILIRQQRYNDWLEPVRKVILDLLRINVS